MSSSTLDRAIAIRWSEQDCDDLFKQFWLNPLETGFHPLNDGEARPLTPMPYAVYEKFAPVRRFRSTGSGCEPTVEVEYFDCTFQFRLRAFTHKRGQPLFGRTGKDILREIVGQSHPDGTGLLAVFDDASGLLDLGGNDRHMCTISEPDFPVREDDDVWAWVVPFTIQFERRRTLRGATV